MNGSMFIGTWWALVPPLLAILLAFVTKKFTVPVHRIGSRCPFVHRLPSVGCVHKLL